MINLDDVTDDYCVVFFFSGWGGRNATPAEDSLHQYSTIRIRKRISFQQVPVQVGQKKYFIQISIKNILIVVSFQTKKNRDSGSFGSDRATSEGKCWAEII